MSTSSVPYDWIREIKPELKRIDEIPLTGAGPAFPWDQLSSRLAHSFEKGNIRIIPGEVRFRTKDELFEGFGDSPIPLTLSIPSLEGSVYWIMPEQEMAYLETLLLTKDTHPISFQDRTLSEAFYRFLALEVLYNITQINYDKSIAPILMSESYLPDEDALCMDISITINQQILWGRLIVSSEMRRSWIDHFAKKNEKSPLASKLAKIIDVNVRLEIGKTQLSHQEWSNLRPGDWVALDQFTLDEEFQGSLMLTVDSRNAFHGTLKDGKIQITESPL